MVHPFEIVAHPLRRRIVEVLATGEHSAGVLSEIALTELGVTRTAVSHQLRTGAGNKRRTHRFAEAERRRRRDALAEWADGADAEL